MTVLALYTTIYPGVEKFLPEWYSSIKGQTDLDFQLWIGLDGMEIAAAERAMGGRPRATWVLAEIEDTPAQMRQRALAQIVENCDAVIMVDSDDVLHPSRVAAARAALRTSDLVGCALRVVDEFGQDLTLTLRLPEDTNPGDVLPRNNVFGLSNSAYRSGVLRRCLPIPADAVLVDWFLATRAWQCGATLTFDPTVRMDYRQHSANLARIRPPFTASRVSADTDLVRRHFGIVHASPPPGALPDRVALVEEVSADIEAFHRHVVLRRQRLERYVGAFNALAPSPLWWSCVAHPALRQMWTTRKEPT
jgi:hypothetical protein